MEVVRCPPGWNGADELRDLLASQAWIDQHAVPAIGRFLCFKVQQVDERCVGRHGASGVAWRGTGVE